MTETEIFCVGRTRPQTLERLERQHEKLLEAFEALKTQAVTAEKKMLQTDADWREWRAGSESRDREQTAAIDRMETSVEQQGSDFQALDVKITGGFETVSGGFTRMQETLDGLRIRAASRDAVEADRKERAPRDRAGSLRRTTAAAPEAAPGGAPSAQLAVTRGYVDLIKSIPPIWILILLVCGGGCGVTLAIILAAKYL